MAKKQVKRRRKQKKSTNKYSTTQIVLLIILAIGIVISIIFAIKDVRKSVDNFESEKYSVKGIDLSHHNPIVNWDEVIAQNISFAYMKATEGINHNDRNYKYNYERAKEVKIPVGTYHFYSFGVSGKEQAKYFMETGKFATGDLLPAIDVEHSPANPYSADKKYTNLVVKELKILENELYEHFGVHPIIYTNRDCYKLYIKDYFPENILWMCDLQKEPSDDIKNWRIWQFSHKGKLPSIDGDIDLNYYRYSFKEFHELLLP